MEVNMPKKEQKEKLKKRRVTFSFDAPKAKEVILMGDFNNWQGKPLLMKMNQLGIWQKIVMLYPKRYEYRFLVDGQWFNDPLNDQTCPNCFGSQNNVIIISWFSQSSIREGPGIWAIGFVTGKVIDRRNKDEMLLKVFVPKTSESHIGNYGRSQGIWNKVSGHSVWVVLLSLK